ncbi:MAG: hypothetical protein AABX51_08200 [Nanoarchaeota archaeon]
MSKLLTFCDALIQMIDYLVAGKTRPEKVRGFILDHITFVKKACEKVQGVDKEMSEYIYYLDQLKGPLNKAFTGSAKRNAEEVKNKLRPSFENKLRAVAPNNILLK